MDVLRQCKGSEDLRGMLRHEQSHFVPSEEDVGHVLQARVSGWFNSCQRRALLRAEPVIQCVCPNRMSRRRDITDDPAGEGRGKRGPLEFSR